MAEASFGKLKVRLFLKKLNLIFLEMGLATSSEIFPDVRSVLHDRNMLGEVLCGLAEDCNICIFHVGITGSENGKRAGENDFGQALLYSLW